MAQKRIKQLSTIAPTSIKYVAHEGDTGGTGKATVADVVAAGADAIGIVRQTPARNVGFDDLNAPSGGWLILDGQGNVVDTLTANGFVSDGAMAFGIATRGIGADYTLVDQFTAINPSIALVPDASTTTLEYRIWRLQSASGTDDTYAQLAFGAVHVGISGPTDVFALIDTAGTWALATQVAGGDPTLTPITMPAGDTLQVKFVLSNTAWRCYVSVDDGASYSDLGDPLVVPSQVTFVPWIHLEGTEHGTDHGDRFSAVDWFRWDSARGGSGASLWDGSSAPKWPTNPDPGSGSDIQAVNYGGSSSAGSANRYARADHVHQGPDAPANPGTGTTNVGTTIDNGASSDYARTDHVHALTVGTLGGLLSSLSTQQIGAGTGSITVEGTSVTVQGTGAVSLQGNVDGTTGQVSCDGFGDVSATTPGNVTINGGTSTNVGNGGLGSPTNVNGSVVTIQGDGSGSVLISDVELTNAELVTNMGAGGFKITNLGNPATAGDAIPLGFLDVGNYAPAFTNQTGVSLAASAANWTHVVFNGVHFVFGIMTLSSSATARPTLDISVPTTITTLRSFLMRGQNAIARQGAVGQQWDGLAAIQTSTTLRVTLDYSASTAASGISLGVLIVYE